MRDAEALLELHYSLPVPRSGAGFCKAAGLWLKVHVQFAYLASLPQTAPRSAPVLTTTDKLLAT